MFSESITKAVFENCLRVTIRRIPRSRTVSLGLFVNHGVKDEDTESNGISHFLEHVLFNHRNMEVQAKRLLGALMDQGALYEAFTGKEMTLCTLSAQRQHVPEMLDTLSHIVRRCNTQAENIEHERAIILQEADAYFASARVKEELIEQALWGKRSLGLFVIGNRTNIARFGAEELDRRFERFYTPANTQLVIQGDLAADEAFSHVSQAFSNWQHASRQNQDVYIEVEPSILGVGKANRVDLTIAFVGPTFHSRERQTMNLLADLLGRGLKSRLFVELREKRELVYSAHAYAQSYELSGYLAININCQKERLRDVYQAVMEVLDEIKLHGVGEAELCRVKAVRTTALLQVPNDTAKHLQVTGRYALLGKDFFVDLERSEIESVTSEDILQLARSMFVEDNMGLSALGADSEELSSLL